MSHRLRQNLCGSSVCCFKHTIKNTLGLKLKNFQHSDARPHLPDSYIRRKAKSFKQNIN